MRCGLRLVPVVLHDLLEDAIILSDFTGDVDGTHDHLVHVSVAHQFRVVNDGVLETGPDFLAEVLVAYVQSIT